MKRYQIETKDMKGEWYPCKPTPFHDEKQAIAFYHLVVAMYHDKDFRFVEWEVKQKTIEERVK